MTKALIKPEICHHLDRKGKRFALNCIDYEVDPLKFKVNENWKYVNCPRCLRALELRNLEKEILFSSRYGSLNPLSTH